VNPGWCLLAEGTHFSNCGVGVWAVRGAKAVLHPADRDGASSTWIAEPALDRVLIRNKELWAYLRSTSDYCSFICCRSAICASASK
jgi:hypothetical protein